MAQQKPGVMLCFELRPSLRRLSSRERLALYDAIMDYGEWGVVPDFTGKLAVAWDFVQPKLDRDDEAYLRNVQQRRYALYARECKRDGAEPLSYKEWRVSKDSEAERPTSGDNGSYPSTNSNPNPNSNPDPNPTSCCYDSAAGKPPRQPQRLIPPTVEEVRAYAAQRGNPPEPTPTAPGRDGSKPPAAAQPLNIQRTAQLRQLREAKSLPYRAWAYELRYHHLQIVFSRNCRAAHPPVFLLICPHRGAEVLDVKNRI